MSRLLRKSLIATAAAAASFGVLAGGTAVAEPPEAQASWYTEESAWRDEKDKGGVSIYEQAIRNDSSQQYVMGEFQAYGENLTVWDHHNNDRKSIVKLWVGGSGPAVFYSDGDGTKKTIPLSYDEGQAAKLQACTSDGPNAVCTEKLVKGRT
ncbi:MAG: hypothetical protein ACTH2Q_00660 [Propionibacteriaceae bacterium]